MLRQLLKSVCLKISLELTYYEKKSSNKFIFDELCSKLCYHIYREFGDKRILCNPQDIIGNIIKYNCFAQITELISQSDKDIHSIYFFKYKNKEIEFEKTISELYNDNKNEANDSNLISYISVNNITSNNTTAYEKKK